MNAHPLADPERLRALRDDYGDVALKALEVFESTAGVTLAELRAAQDAGDADAVRRLAHRLSGSARTVGATAMAELAAALEAAAPDGPKGLEPLEAALPSTVAALRAALAA
jgi:HPt (histidine-containing phosphotransfer) domain-containing protein